MRCVLFKSPKKEKARARGDQDTTYYTIFEEPVVSPTIAVRALLSVLPSYGPRLMRSRSEDVLVCVSGAIQMTTWLRCPNGSGRQTVLIYVIATARRLSVPTVRVSPTSPCRPRCGRIRRLVSSPDSRQAGLTSENVPLRHLLPGLSLCGLQTPIAMPNLTRPSRWRRSVVAALLALENGWLVAPYPRSS